MSLQLLDKLYDMVKRINNNIHSKSDIKTAARLFNFEVVSIEMYPCSTIFEVVVKTLIKENKTGSTVDFEKFLNEHCCLEHQFDVRKK